MCCFPPPTIPDLTIHFFLLPRFLSYFESLIFLKSEKQKKPLPLSLSLFLSLCLPQREVVQKKRSGLVKLEREVVVEMRSHTHEEDGVWLFPLRTDVEVRRVARAPVSTEQRGLRPVVISDRQRGVIRVFDAKIAREVCAAPAAPPPVHSDFTAPSFASKISQSDAHQFNTCISMLVVDTVDGSSEAASSCEVWTGWASGHVAVYALHQGQRTNMSVAERTAPPVRCELLSMLFAHRGAVHALSASSQMRIGDGNLRHLSCPRYIFSASYDCNILQFETTSRSVVRSISSACRNRGDFPTSMVRSLVCSLKGICVRRDAGLEGGTTIHDTIYLSMDNRSHYLVAVGGDDEPNDVAMQLVSSSRACCKVAIAIDGGAAPVLCTGDEDGAVFFLPLLVAAASPPADDVFRGTAKTSSGVTNGQYLVYLSNMYSSIRSSAAHQQQGQYELALHKGPIVDAVLVSTHLDSSGSASHRLIVACAGKPTGTLIGVHVTVASHGGVTCCAATFAVAVSSPILHIAAPFLSASESPPSEGHAGKICREYDDGVFYVCGSDGTLTVLSAVDQPVTVTGRRRRNDGSSSTQQPSALRLREVVDMVQRAKLMSLAADAALEKQLSISSKLLDDQRVLQEQCTRLTAALELKTAELVELGSVRSSVEALKSSLHSKMTLLEEDNAQLRAELAQAGEHVGMLRKRLEDADGSVAAGNARIDELLSQLLRKDEAMKLIAKEKDSVGNSLAERVGESKILASNVMNLERKLAKAEEELRGCEQRRQRDQRIIDDQQIIVEELRGKVVHAQAEASALRGKLTDSELSLQLAKAKQQSVRDILVKQGILLDGPHPAGRRQLVSSGVQQQLAQPPPAPDPFNLDNLLSSSVRPSDGVFALSLSSTNHPPTDLQQASRTVNVSIDSERSGAS